MAKQKDEEIKKHGDKLETLIERTGATSSPGKRGEPQDPTEQQDDDDEEDVRDDDGSAGVDDDEYVEDRNARSAAEIYEQRLSRLTIAYRMLVSAPPRRWH